ncbi:MAG: AIR synthase-related protein, partial [Nitrospinota bacterium]|nr:AIR synthase-related protein [Nitrospinota bacterium]
GHCIGLIGFTMEELGGSEYLKVLFDKNEGKPPVLDRKQEKHVQKFCLELIHKELIQSAHDCSKGGLVIAVAESCFSSPEETLGATLELESTLRGDALMFSESQSRIVISFPEELKNQIENLALSYSINFSLLGKTGGSQFIVNINSQEYIKQDIETIKEIWKTSLGRYVGQTT